MDTSFERQKSLQSSQQRSSDMSRYTPGHNQSKKISYNLFDNILHSSLSNGTRTGVLASVPAHEAEILFPSDSWGQEDGSRSTARSDTHKNFLQYPVIQIDNNNNDYTYPNHNHSRCFHAPNPRVAVYGIKAIPSWNIYFADQKGRMSNFSVPGNTIQSNADLNRCVSLAFSDISITAIAVDAVVNPTTEFYAGIVGVDKIIHEEAGPSLRQACSSLPPLGIGQVEITPGFQLPAKYIIHTNGPYLTGSGDEYLQLEKCYENSLSLMQSRSLRTIVFPCISTGEKRLNKDTAARIALKTVRSFLEQNRSCVDRIIFSLHGEKNAAIYRRFMQVYFPC